MKFPQILTYLTVLLFVITVEAQTTTLTTLPSGLYFENVNGNISSTLNSDTHKILYNALKAADLEEILELSGPFTVFAPTNNAFAKFSKKELETLFKTENKTKLKNLLTYHIVAGNLTASKILRAMCRGNGKASFTTVQGNKIFATMRGTDIMLSDSDGNQARITVADANQSNGIIHQIDSVIVPSGI